MPIAAWASSLAFHALTLRMTISKAMTHLDRLRRAAAELSSIIAEDEQR